MSEEWWFKYVTQDLPPCFIPELLDRRPKTTKSKSCLPEAPSSFLSGSGSGSEAGIWGKFPPSAFNTGLFKDTGVNPFVFSLEKGERLLFRTYPTFPLRLDSANAQSQEG